MHITVLPCGPLEANCYIISDEESKNCLAIDPGDSRTVLDFLLENHLCLKKILLTHGHFDHCMGVASLCRETKAQVYMHSSDLELIAETSPLRKSQFPAIPYFTIDCYLQANDVVSLDSISLHVLYTPGHSKGGVSFFESTEKLLFSGDTLFCGSYGRTDLYGGSMKELIRSVIKTLFVLPDETIVYPGHESSTTIAHEKKWNPLSKLKNHPWLDEQ